VLKVNLLSVLIQLSADNASKWFYNKFEEYYSTLLNSATHYNRFAGRFDRDKKKAINHWNKDYDLTTTDLRVLLKSKKNLKLFVPINRKSTREHDALLYKTEEFFCAKDIIKYWSEDINIEKQKEEIDLILRIADIV